MHVSLVLAAAALALSVGVPAQTPAASSQRSGAAGDVKNGRELYLSYKCYACHGYSGQNGPGTRLVPPRMTLPAFTAYVRDPLRMPPYTATVVPDRELADIWAYLQTLPRSPAAKDIPLLNEMLTEK
jgi:mono/diheme cytochrome c family protein